MILPSTQKKISGSAQTRKNGIILQHGTLMFNTNIELMEKALRVSNQKMEIRKRITTLSKEGYSIDKKELIKNLKKGFEEIYGKSNKGKLSKEELSLAKKLAYEKYNSKEWNHKK